MRYIANVKIFRLKLLLIFYFATLTHAALAASTGIGVYSHDAVDLWSQVAGTPKPFTILSPDKRTSVRVTYIEDKVGNEKVLLHVNGAMGPGTIALGPGVGSELLWSPDSRSFFVTTSDEGANGSYRLLIAEQFGGKFGSRDLSKLIYRAFGSPVRCGAPELPNVGGIKWLGESGNVLVAAEIVAHSNCDSNGTFKAYEVDPRTMRVMKSYGQLEAKHLFGDSLGVELRDAPDECIRDPRSCYVSTNHPTGRP
jgi:hypothetical protein